MNYRHAFHAGNFADCMKHALLVWLLRAMLRKPAAIFMLDTHAGAGQTDLAAGPAERTGEWRAGIGRILPDPPAALADYAGLVCSLGLYPGSPRIARALLRPHDRLACCELHPDDHAALRAAFFGDAQTATHRRDGYAAIGALLPAAARRALVLIDPPYEAPGEFDRVLAGLRVAAARMPAAVCAAWYPVKGRAPVRAFHDAVRAAHLPDVAAAELWLREPTDAARLNGCGLLVRNPPYLFESEAPGLLAALLSRLSLRERGEGFSVVRLTEEG